VAMPFSSPILSASRYAASETLARPQEVRGGGYFGVIVISTAASGPRWSLSEA
jgi:hypothetical protein